MKKELQNEEITRIIVTDRILRNEKTLSLLNAKTKSKFQSSPRKMTRKMHSQRSPITPKNTI